MFLMYYYNNKLTKMFFIHENIDVFVFYFLEPKKLLCLTNSLNELINVYYLLIIFVICCYTRFNISEQTLV